MSTTGHKAAKAPAVPFGARFDFEASLVDNARNAREADKRTRRSQFEHNARVLARRVFGRDDFEFDYDPKIGHQDTPSFTVEGELIAYDGSVFRLMEFCSDCGESPNGREFGTLAQFGAALEERDDAEAHVCQLCRISRGVKR